MLAWLLALLMHRHVAAPMPICVGYLDALRRVVLYFFALSLSLFEGKYADLFACPGREVFY
jgi:hypothetical protein